MTHTEQRHSCHDSHSGLYYIPVTVTATFSLPCSIVGFDVGAALSSNDLHGDDRATAVGRLFMLATSKNELNCVPNRIVFRFSTISLVITIDTYDMQTTVLNPALVATTALLPFF